MYFLTCLKCNKTKPTDDFVIPHNIIDSTRYLCRQCDPDDPVDDETGDYSLWSWDNIHKAADANIFIEAVLSIWQEGPDLTAEKVLLGMVLLQDNALKTIEELQEQGWHYGKHPIPPPPNLSPE